MPPKIFPIKLCVAWFLNIYGRTVQHFVDPLYDIDGRSLWELPMLCKTNMYENIVAVQTIKLTAIPVKSPLFPGRLQYLRCWSLGSKLLLLL